MVTCCGLDEILVQYRCTSCFLPFQDILFDEGTSAEKEGGWEAGELVKCEVVFESGTMEKDSGHRNMRRRIPVRERSRNISFSLRRSRKKRKM